MKHVEHVHVAEYPHPALRIDHASVFDRKRHAYWQNRRRNDTIAAIAQAISHGDAQKLVHLGMFLSGDLPAAVRRPGCITVLAESPMQAREIATRLPRFDLLIDGQAIHHGTDRQLCPAKVILTLVAAFKATEFAPSVLINAVGGRFAPTLQRLLTLPHARPVIIDLADRFCEQAAYETFLRLWDYRSQGFALSPAAERLLAEHSSAGNGPKPRRGIQLPERQRRRSELRHQAKQRR